MSSEAEVRQRLVAYLAGQLGLKDLDAELSSVTWDAGAAATVRDLANEIELRINEFSSGSCTQEQMDAALRPLVTDYKTQMLIGAVSDVCISTGNSSVFSSSPIATTPQLSGTPLEEVFS